MAPLAWLMLGPTGIQLAAAILARSQCHPVQSSAFRSRRDPEIGLTA